MKILLINGSPRGIGSNTLKLANAFIAGMNEAKEYQIDIINLSTENIDHCLGCLTCWHSKDGICAINDNMSSLIKKYMRADIIVWSFPLYYFGMPSKMKAFLDRLLPLNYPQITVRPDGTASHPSRYNKLAKRHVLISTCGFYSVEKNYEALLIQFALLFGDSVTKIICPEGELFRIPQLATRIEEYLHHVQSAGRDYSSHGCISADTYTNLNTLLFPEKSFVEMANSYWTENLPALRDENRENPSKAFLFLRQMASLYTSSTLKNDIIIEFYFNDIDEIYQLKLGKEKCEIDCDAFSPYTTRIETPFLLWKDISEKKVNGAEALMNRKYRVLGDFSVMQKMSDYFSANEGKKDTKLIPHSAMSILLFPWFAFWLVFPWDAHLSGITGVVASALVPVLGLKFKLTIYDALTAALVSVLSLAVLCSLSPKLIHHLSYLLFGGMWAVSYFAQIPLSAYYSCNAHGGEKAFSNPLFIKTNRILTLVWGILYIVIAGYCHFSTIQKDNPYLLAINLTFPMIMGLFTVWFIRWYPAKIARG